MKEYKWPDHLVERLKVLCGLSNPIEVIALKLGLPVTTCYSKIKELGISIAKKDPIPEPISPKTKRHPPVYNHIRNPYFSISEELNSNGRIFI